MNFTDWLSAIKPAWLSGPWGKKWDQVFGGFVEAITDSTNDANLARLVLKAPDDALPYIGAERWTERGRLETLVSYRARLADFWEQAQKWGTDDGIIGALKALPIVPASTFVQSYHDGWTGYGESTWWSRFWVLFEGAHGFQPDGRWSDAGNYDDGGVWDLDEVTPEDLQYLRRTIWRWKDAEGIPVRAFFVSFDHVWDSPGVWDSPADLWADAMLVSLPLGHFWDDEALVPHNDLTWDAPGETWGVKPDGVI